LLCFKSFPDEDMEEIQRRLVIEQPRPNLTSIFLAPNPPPSCFAPLSKPCATGTPISPSRPRPPKLSPTSSKASTATKRKAMVQEPTTALTSERDAKRLRRRMKNREAAQHSRERKKQYVLVLEGKISELKTRNEDLERELLEARRVIASLQGLPSPTLSPLASTSSDGTQAPRSDGWCSGSESTDSCLGSLPPSVLPSVPPASCSFSQHCATSSSSASVPPFATSRALEVPEADTHRDSAVVATSLPSMVSNSETSSHSRKGSVSLGAQHHPLRSMTLKRARADQEQAERPNSSSLETSLASPSHPMPSQPFLALLLFLFSMILYSPHLCFRSLLPNCSWTTNAQKRRRTTAFLHSMPPSQSHLTPLLSIGRTTSPSTVFSAIRPWSSLSNPHCSPGASPVPEPQPPRVHSHRPRLLRLVGYHSQLLGHLELVTRNYACMYVIAGFVSQTVYYLLRGALSRRGDETLCASSRSLKAAPLS